MAYAGVSPAHSRRRCRIDCGVALPPRQSALSRFTCDPLPDLGGRPVVFVANHTSFSDVFYAVAVLSDWRYPARCLVRYSYFRPAIVGRWLRTLLCVPAGGGGTDAVTEGVEILKAGWPIAVMVEAESSA